MPEVERTKLSDLLQPAHRHLDVGEIEAAKSLLDQGLQQWPEAGLLLAARFADIEGRTGEALFHEAAAALRAEAERFPKPPGSRWLLPEPCRNAAKRMRRRPH